MRLKTGFADFIDKYPTWILYVRQNQMLRCSCFDEGTMGGDATCMSCLGTGYKITYSKLPVRINLVGLRTIPDTNLSPGIGSLHEAKIYFKQHHYPQIGDLAMEVSWNVDANRVQTVGQPTKIIHIYKIEDLYVYREDEISFITAGCALRDSNKYTIESYLLRTGI